VTEGSALNMDNYQGRGFQGMIARATKEWLNIPGWKVLLPRKVGCYG